MHNETVEKKIGRKIKLKKEEEKRMTQHEYTTYNRKAQKSGKRKFLRVQIRKGALTIEWFTKHTKELRHEDRVQQNDRGDGTRLSMGKRKSTGKMKYFERRITELK